MFAKLFKYILPVAALALFSLSSCSDDPLTPEKPESALDSTDGFTLNVNVTLDNMGGRATSLGDPLADIENYINPEKFRVLFFDSDDKFLFESKSRWMKKLSTGPDHTEWLVSVPFYDSGNDVAYGWKWEKIREKLTGGSFKIAVLANRPNIECFPDLKDNQLGGAKQFDNSGPNWTVDDMGVKDIFDIHHSQWDPIYTSKGKRNNGSAEGYYEFIMGVDPTKGNNYDTKLTMSSTSCWVDHGPTFSDDGEKHTIGSTANRCFILPSHDYPIPMYGVQKFDKIEGWVEGTPFNLSKMTQGSNSTYNFKKISLLRSVVKLELLISKSYGKPNLVQMKYPNIYARCEPMDVWTPTELIWKNDDGSPSTATNGNYGSNCEITSIMNYGAVARAGDATGTETNNDASFRDYRKRISWFYGVWKEKKWPFGTLTSDGVVAETSTTPYPRIFNPLVQRNANVSCKFVDVTSYYNDNYYHYVVYTGERSMNDPSYLYNLGNVNGDGQSPTIHWVFDINNTVHCIPIAPYSTTIEKYCTTATYSSSAWPNNNLTYDYGKAVGNNPFDKSILPWPLVRNHVYSISVGKTGSSRAFGDSDDFDLEYTFEDRASSTISFPD